MKLRTSFSILIVSALTLTACGVSMSPEEEQRRIEDWRQLGETRRHDLREHTDDLIQACVARMEGQRVNDAALSRAPFKKTVKGDQNIYSGHWQGEYVAKIDSTLLVTEPGECQFSIGSSEQPVEGRKLVFYQLTPEFEVGLRNAGYRLTKVRHPSLGAVFASASLRALIPGPNIKKAEGQLIAVKGAHKLDISIYTYRSKQDQSVQRAIVEVTKAQGS